MPGFVETIHCDLTEAQADSDARMIKRVVLIRAGESKNKRLYPPEVLQQAAPIFEGVKAFADHGKGARSIRDVTGWYTNVTFENDALYADRYFSRTQAGQDALALAEDILSRRAPAHLAGLSINAVGQARPNGEGNIVVESILSAASVDDVIAPAAGGTYLTASEDERDLTNALIEAMTFEQWFESRPEFIKRVQNEMKTVRQEKALTEAQALAEARQAALAQAQAEREALEEAHAAALAELAMVRREMLLNEALRKVRLPEEWLNSLRTMLLEADPSQWDARIAEEMRKAKAVRPAVPVSGAEQRVHRPVLTQEAQQTARREEAQRLAEAEAYLQSTGRLTLPGETFAQWRQRTAQAKQE